jgi:2-dehydropantoate 2-reductase
MTLHILGGGSIGLLYASSMRLARRNKIPICLLLQSHHEDKLRPCEDPPDLNQGSASRRDHHELYVPVKMTDFHGNVHLQNIRTEILQKDNDEKQDIQNVLLATKAPHSVSALESIYARFHPTEKVNLVVMTNGSLSVVDEVQQSLHEEGIREKVNIIYASTTHGAIRGDEKHSFSVNWTGVGQTFIQEGNEDRYDTNQDSLQHMLHKSWMEVGMNSSLISCQDMYILNWKKLATNCAINPLTALRRCQNGDLLSEKIDTPTYEETFNNADYAYDDARLFYKLIREVSDVSRAEAEYWNDSSMDIPTIMQELSYENLANFVENVVCQTSRNQSSMLQDILAKRYPTEIKHLNGYVSDLGQERHGIEVKANSTISTEVEMQSKLNSDTS